MTFNIHSNVILVFYDLDPQEMNILWILFLVATYLKLGKSHQGKDD